MMKSKEFQWNASHMHNPTRNLQKNKNMFLHVKISKKNVGKITGENLLNSAP